ncbi:MAG TPA: alpha-(1-_3)-arabinofuranosyltransferase family protein, partial [Candidatus Dormibacteraeota bacterium]|nr:alpha-(1->3)-arabinofuranosyltransferase family protein [Candidatus Dormibacteraeota bacterium]
LQKWLVPALFAVLALLVTTGYGSGIQLNDGQASLHIDPLRFMGWLLHAWNPSLALGTHSGFWVPYQTPYSWLYGLAQIAHVPQDVAQHAAVFLVYLGCLWAMYYCLRGVAPWLDEVSRIAGSCAYLFNMYVALNSQAQIVWLLTYGTLPAMVGVMARAMRGEMNIWRAALALALLVLVGGGVNPPLVAINVIVIAIFVIVTIAFDPKPANAINRTLPIVAAAAIAAVAINLYWLVPFVDYFRTVWLNGVLSESTSMHNAATSFANVLRGLGHWATFVSFAGRAYFPWAASYASGLFGALLWFVPIVALGGIALRRNQRPATLFFLIVTIVSVPLVVGYYHDELGAAVTAPIYDQFYRNFPGFQMFRFSYKWVAGVEFGISGLFALSCFAIVTALRDYFSKLTAGERRRWDWAIPAARTAFIVLPILIFVPVLINKMNYPGRSLPSWEYRAASLVGNDKAHRVALFPTQFLEQFDWGNPQFYIEDSLIDRPMIYGLLGSEPSEGTDLWVRRAYRASREGLPFAADMYRVMGVDTILQRDDSIPVIDFSSPGEWRFNSTTLTHDLLHRVLGVSPVRTDGPLRVYHLSGAMPLFYGVTHPVVSTVPTFSDALLGDVEAMAQGRAEFDPPNRSADEFTSSLQGLSPILPGSPEQLRDLAVNEALVHGIRVHPPSADAAWLTRFEIKTGGLYSIFVLDQSLLFNRPAPQTLMIDGKYLSLENPGGAWTQFSNVGLTPGTHWVSDGYLDPDLVVAVVNTDDLRSWQDRIAALTRSLPQNLATASIVDATKTTVTLPGPGRYKIRATAIGPFGPDGLVGARLRRGSAYRGAFPATLSGTLPYIFDSGVVPTSQIMMPTDWYRDDPTAYQWQRGDPASWFLFLRDAHARVFVPGSSGVRARVSMRISRLQVADTMTVTVKGGASQSVALPGPAGKAEQYDSPEHLDGPTPAVVGFAVDLHPGWNDVAFTFHSQRGERSDLGSDVISAAVAPDLSFVQAGAAPSAPRPQATDSAFTAVALSPPAAGLTGDPEVTGSVAGSGGRGVSLAVALDSGGKVAYRLFPIARDGSFDVNFMHAFPNDWSDASRRIVGLWFIARGGHPQLSSLYYGVHATPGRALRRPQSLANIPIRIDGRPVGSAPVFLSGGRHTVASGDKQVKIGLLTLEPLTLPRTRDFGLVWERRAPTAIDVTAKSTASPFLLVFGEAFHPEWRATLEGEVLPHVIVNGVENGWIVPTLPAGGKIVLTFAAQQYYIIAGAISVIALLILIVLACSPGLWPIRTRNS